MEKTKKINKLVIVIKDKKHWNSLKRSKKYAGLDLGDEGYPWLIPVQPDGSIRVALPKNIVINLAATLAETLGEEWFRRPKIM